MHPLTIYLIGITLSFCLTLIDLVSQYNRNKQLVLNLGDVLYHFMLCGLSYIGALVQLAFLVEDNHNKIIFRIKKKK